ncbi:MAG: outer membrane beta-barrel domain-containing protein [Deltaproteobacteria bacterium]|nr:outer membrane beta-barrel domain-containing protein [Deltaproteobacteria bacterium]
MKRFRSSTGCCLLVLSLALSGQAYAQNEGGEGKQEQKGDQEKPEGGAEDGAKEGEEGVPPEQPEAPPPSDDALKTKQADLQPTATPSISSGPRDLREQWKDIVVIPRKTFLKRRRVELSPFVGTSVNDNLIQHTAIGGELNYHITDILSIGAMGMYYFPQVLDQEFFTRYHFRKVPSLNKYKGTVVGNMSYVPIYGKFSVFNKWIWHYEIFVTGGVGVSFTEIIPRDYDYEPFSNLALTFPIGMGGRLFITRWLAAQVSFRDFMMLDKFEPPGRQDVDGAKAKEKAETRFINNVMFTAGFSFYLPLDFSYTTFR